MSIKLLISLFFQHLVYKIYFSSNFTFYTYIFFVTINKKHPLMKSECFIPFFIL